MTILDKRLVVMLHDQLIRETGGSQGIRDEGLLESALSVPFQEFGGVFMLTAHDDTGLQNTTQDSN